MLSWQARQTARKMVMSFNFPPRPSGNLWWMSIASLTEQTSQVGWTDK